MPPKPLVVDLDGTLFLGDSAWENLRILTLRNPWRFPGMLAQFLRGRAALKCWLHQEIGRRNEPPTMRPEVSKLVQQEQAKGRAVHLVSGAPQALVDETARRLGLDLRVGHWGSQPRDNLTHAKKPFLVQRFGRGGMTILEIAKLTCLFFPMLTEGPWWGPGQEWCVGPCRPTRD